MLQLLKNIKFNQFWLFTILVVLLLMFPSLVQKGMFLDGVTYATISNNLANGFGSFFDLHYTKVLMSHFKEHPPLVFWIQSFFFKVFGNHFWVEKIFSFLNFILTGFGMLLLFNFFFERKKYNWFPILLFIITPLIFWCYNNNILENTLTVFVVFSGYFQLKYLKTNKIHFLIFASFFIIGAFLAKGFVGLFPLITPIIYLSAVDKNYKKYLLTNFLLIVITLLTSVLILYVFPDLKVSLKEYFNTQLIPALKGKREITTQNRFKILFDLVFELTLPIVIFLAVYFTSKIKELLFKKEALFFILVGLSGSLPLIISLKQRKFYLAPTFPFFIVGLSLLILPFIIAKFDVFYKNKKKVLQGINLVLAMVLLVLILNFDGYFRDKDKIQDIEKIAFQVERGSIMSSTKSLTKDWGTVAYLSRINYLSVTNKLEHHYFIKPKKEKISDEVAKSYTKLDLGLVKFDLYKRK